MTRLLYVVEKTPVHSRTILKIVPTTVKRPSNHSVPVCDFCGSPRFRAQAIREISVIRGGEFIWRAALNGGSPATVVKAPPLQSDGSTSQSGFFASSAVEKVRIKTQCDKDTHTTGLKHLFYGNLQPQRHCRNQLTLQIKRFKPLSLLTLQENHHY